MFKLTLSSALLLILVSSIQALSIKPKKDIPNFNEPAKMARYLVHAADWGAIAYISYQNDTKGVPMTQLFGLADGPVSSGSGVPYFYISRLDVAVDDILDHGHVCSMLLSLDQTDECKERSWDPMDPRCARAVITGTLEKMSNDTEEYQFAEESMFSRHPTYSTLPESHHFFLAKLNIEKIVVQLFFGGPATVTVDEYYNVHSRSLNLRRYDSKTYTIQIV